MSNYSHRQRVLLALDHQEPDRIPIDMMGNATMLFDQTYIRLRDHLGLPAIPPVRSGTTTNYYDERILEHFDIDFRRVFLKEKSTDRTGADPNDVLTDPWGVQYKQAGLYVNVLSHPLQNARIVEDIEAYPWPKADELFCAEGLAQEAEQLYTQTDYALVARNPLSLGFLDRACRLMGMAEFMMAIISAADVAECLLEHLLHFYKRVYDIFLSAVGPYVQVVETADDLGTQESLLISPELYRKFIKPLEKQFYTLIREKAPNAFIFRHTDGAISQIIPDLIEVGVDILNPVQTSAQGMQARSLKQKHGKSISFHGAIEKTGGPVDQLVCEVKERIAAFAPGGGYVLASCNHMIDVEPENIIAMFETACDYGRYSKLG
jgi:uroporphyrinogen decarboxylase